MPRTISIHVEIRDDQGDNQQPPVAAEPPPELHELLAWLIEHASCRGGFPGGEAFEAQAHKLANAYGWTLTTETEQA